MNRWSGSAHECNNKCMYYLYEIKRIVKQCLFSNTLTYTYIFIITLDRQCGFYRICGNIYIYDYRKLDNVM